MPPDSLKLARAFLGYYHELHREDLSGWNNYGRKTNNPIEYIGDDQEHEYYPVRSAKARNVLPEDRVGLPNRTIADAWGSAAE